MRDIKFRYMYGIEGKPDTYFTKIFTLDEIEQGYPIDVLCNEPLLKSYALLFRDQFAELTDKNGVDVYGADVVNYVYEPGEGCWNYNQRSVISFKGSSFHMAGIKGGLQAYFPSIPGAFMKEDEDRNKLFEVIGNIHKNPELLR